MKATAVAPANIAFIKFWGKKDASLRIPFNTSISMNLSGAVTTTTVEFSPKYKIDEVTLIDGVFSDTEKERVVEHLDRIRKKAGMNLHARVATKNSFPKSTGIASSASGFAALTVAAAGALGLNLSEKELTILARLGSGSACRSIPDGFVKWKDTFAYSLYPAHYWDLRDILVIVENTAKDVSSSAGHDLASTSPYFSVRLGNLPERIARVEVALKEKDFQKLGEAIEEDSLDMHQVMQTQNPPLMYWNDATKILMDAAISWRKNGLPVYFTIDAGPNVHLICEGKDEEGVVKVLRSRIPLRGTVKEVIINKPAAGTHLIGKHLF